MGDLSDGSKNTMFRATEVISWTAVKQILEKITDIT